MRPSSEAAICIAVGVVLVAVFVVCGNGNELCEEIAKPLHEAKRSLFDYASTASPRASNKVPAPAPSTSKAADKWDRAQFWQVDCAESLNTAAQARAKTLAAEDKGPKIGLSKEALAGEYGENVFFIPGSTNAKGKGNVVKAEDNAVHEATEQWFAEIHWYDFVQPAIPAAKGQPTAHFTAMIWKDVHSIGIAVEIAPRTNNVYVVATYLSTPNLGSTEADRLIYTQNVPLPLDKTLKTKIAPPNVESTGQTDAGHNVPLQTVIDTAGKAMPYLKHPATINKERMKIAKLAMYLCEKASNVVDKIKKLFKPTDNNQKDALGILDALCSKRAKYAEIANEYKQCVQRTARSHNIDYFLESTHKMLGIDVFPYEQQIAEAWCEPDRPKNSRVPGALKTKDEYHAKLIAVLERLKKAGVNENANVLIMAIEAQVIKEIQDRKEACKRPGRVAVFYGGGTGAGKTSVARKVFEKDVELREINASKDCPLMMIAHDYYMGLVERYLKRCPATGKDSCFLYQFNMPVGGMVSRLIQLAIKSKINFIWDGTLTNVDRAIAYKDQMVNLPVPEVSYHIHIIGIVADSIVAAMRTWRRACEARDSFLLKREGQQPTYTAHCSVYGSFRDFKQVWGDIVKKFSYTSGTTFHLYDNSNDGQPAQIMYEPDAVACQRMTCEEKVYKEDWIAHLLEDETFFTPAVFEIQLLQRDKDMLIKLHGLDQDCNLCGGRNLAEFYLGRDALKAGFVVSEERLAQIKAILPNKNLKDKCEDEEESCKDQTADACLNPNWSGVRDKCPVRCGRCYPQHFKRVKN